MAQIRDEMSGCVGTRDAGLMMDQEAIIKKFVEDWCRFLMRNEQQGDRGGERGMQPATCGRCGNGWGGGGRGTRAEFWRRGRRRSVGGKCEMSCRKIMYRALRFGKEGMRKEQSVKVPNRARRRWSCWWWWWWWWWCKGKARKVC
ncbi:hypothetical protein LX32DRAFT_250638 [Colletotrichum zoysiae]|uniref:Uncharacterized protein n=1 Tax=Colletotrichum zoysiae TaxID=1216348 RepID=A0AAD9H4Q4_9PEZI|nr:hypothetical protein LX32DRAFT_250638 [Colletotrichum zoysiae]